MQSNFLQSQESFLHSGWPSAIFKHSAYQHQKFFQKNLKFKDFQSQM